MSKEKKQKAGERFYILLSALCTWAFIILIFTAIWTWNIQIFLTAIWAMICGFAFNYISEQIRNE